MDPTDCTAVSGMYRKSNTFIGRVKFPKLIICFYNVQQGEMKLVLPRKTLEPRTFIDSSSGFWSGREKGAMPSLAMLRRPTSMHGFRNNGSLFIKLMQHTSDYNICLLDY